MFSRLRPWAIIREMQMKKQKIQDMFSVSGKVVAITGAAGIIFSTVARALAANGARVALLDIAGDAVNKLAGEIKALIPKVNAPYMPGSPGPKMS
jgi:NADP-dependent 3-hydroxy acid dehydrogenase YdfG